MLQSLPDGRRPDENRAAGKARTRHCALLTGCGRSLLAEKTKSREAVDSFGVRTIPSAASKLSGAGVAPSDRSHKWLEITGPRTLRKLLASLGQGRADPAQDHPAGA